LCIFYFCKFRGTYVFQQHLGFYYYIIVGEVTGDVGDVLEVLLVAGKRDMLNIFIEVASGADLKVKDIDVLPLALQQVLPFDDRRGTAAIINIANELSSILVVENETPRFARIIPTGLQAATEFFNCSPNRLPRQWRWWLQHACDVLRKGWSRHVLTLRRSMS
jgi:hypothetical protein